MKSLPNNKSYLIYLSHKNKEFESKLKDLILSNIKNVEVKTFNIMELDKENFSDADLIIVDLLLDDKCIEDVHNCLDKINKYSAPYLLFTSFESFDPKKISFFNDYPNLVYEFINESIFVDFIFLNRIKVLLNIPKILKTSDIQKQKIQTNIWNFLDYSNMFVLMIDKDLKIKIVNYHLAKTLGYDTPDLLAGKYWTDFLNPVDKDIVRHICEQIIKGSQSYKEYTNDIILSDKSIISVKWFNSLINSSFNCVFSIGLPINKEPTLDEDIDSLRAYFRDILEQDKTTITAMKEITMKYSEKLFNESNPNKNRRSTDK